MEQFTWMWTIMTSMVECTALCESFQCDRKPPALEIRGKGDKRRVWCTWIDEECDGPWCTYSKCKSRRMTDSGMCKPDPKLQYASAKAAAKDLAHTLPDAMPDEYAKKFRTRK